MKQIRLTQSQFALVDDTDFEWLMDWKWFARYSPGGRSFYAVRNIYLKSIRKQTTVHLHRIILSANQGDIIDHINRNTLDNRRSNLRFVTASQSAINRGLLSSNTSGLRGVYLDQRSLTKPWKAQIRLDGRAIYLGRFASAIDAACAYDKAAIKYHGGLANNNFSQQL